MATPLTFIPRFNILQVYNREVLNGTEIMRIYRAPQFHNGGVMDFIYGARWFQADDTFQVNGEGGVLDSTVIHNRVINNLVGSAGRLAIFASTGPLERWR